ncbi:hypothetical protein GCM10017687_29580 [Streptomyces echinatus]|uniref:hypothetical protein n=1 Tax=Streptomyces echinatus TaxID=67293 RepID=UPI0031F04979
MTDTSGRHAGLPSPPVVYDARTPYEWEHACGAGSGHPVPVGATTVPSTASPTWDDTGPPQRAERFGLHIAYEHYTHRADQ